MEERMDLFFHYVRKHQELGKAFLAVLLSLCAVLYAPHAPESKIVQSTLIEVEESRDTVLRFMDVTAGTAIAISALPDDFGSPLADSIANMSKFFLGILVVLFIERLLLLVGSKLVLLVVIPVACLLFALGKFRRRESLTRFSYKLLTFGLVVLLCVPISVRFSQYISQDYQRYVSDTLTEAEAGVTIIQQEMEAEDEDAAEGSSIFDKLSEAFHSAVDGVQDLVKYFKGLIKQYMNAIAILIITDMLIPIGTMFVLKWGIGALFQVSIPIEQLRALTERPFDRKRPEKSQAGKEEEDEKREEKRR